MSQSTENHSFISPDSSLEGYSNFFSKLGSSKAEGRVREVRGFMVKAYNPGLQIGSYCQIINPTTGDKGAGEVIGFEDDCVIVMMFDQMTSIGQDCRIRKLENSNVAGVGFGLLGRIVDGMGEPLDDKKALDYDDHRSLYSEPINPMRRARISSALDVGIKSINGLLSIGKGQRIGIFAGSGVGKSVLLGMLARYTKADIKVIALIGERGREVKEFVEKELGKEGLASSVVIAATSEQSPTLRIRAAYLATTIAEFYRERGLDVLLMMDSVTRFAMARREIGLSIGEPPMSKGYPPSVFSLLPKLFERAGNTDSGGSITGIYTVLASEDDMDDPIVDATRSILDGHIILDRKIAERNHFPAIDILASKSRVMPDVADEKHIAIASKLTELKAIYKEVEDLISVGAYVKGANPKVDRAVEKIDQIDAFLKQGIKENFSFKETLNEMEKIIGKT